MGLPMNNLHAPTIPSGPTSGPPADRSALDGLSLMELISRKDNLEAELKALGSVLDSHGVTMNTSLTTFDGYPRDDLDIAQIRTTRARIIWLKNDYKDIMNRIEKGLHQHHASIGAAGPPKEEGTDVVAGPAGEMPPGEMPPEPPLEPPFARVNTVESGSPAHEANLKVGDRIRTFGAANWANHENLRKVAEMVQRNEGRPILVKVVRDSQELQLRVTPRRNWGGRGTLGCHILPIGG